MIDQWRARPAEMRALMVVALVLEVVAVVAFAAGKSVATFSLLSGLALGIIVSVIVWNFSLRHG